MNEVPTAAPADPVATLSRREAQVYQFLFSKQGVPATTEEIYNAVWAKPMSFSPATAPASGHGIVAVNISYMRRKLGRDAIVKTKEGYSLKQS